MDEAMWMALEHPELVELAVDLVEDQLGLESTEDGTIPLTLEEFEALCLLATVGLEAVAREKARIVESN